MSFVESFKKQIFSINEKSFEDSSLAVFDYQYHACPIYQQYCNSLGKNPTNVTSTYDIPFIPISFFKQHQIKSGEWEPQKIFKSSGTTQSKRSIHQIADLSFYHQVAKIIFENAFDKLNQLKILALLPSYLEQGDSSLISMIDSFFTHSASQSGYYLNNDLTQLLQNNETTILFGVTYALLDLPQMDTNNTIIIETGGMKGRRKELVRSELHSIIKKSLNPQSIWSEYGMTELQSQAYGENGEFKLPKWSKVLIREVNDPFSYVEHGKTGGINIIDLANIQTCSFIETEDLGKAHMEHFEVLGRFDNSDIRGCNLLV